MGWLSDFPDKEALRGMKQDVVAGNIPKVNNHIHTPYSFSAFNSVEEAVKLAVAEGISVLGINDFYVTDGYTEFIESCRREHIFPLLNIELIGIDSKLQTEGVRINDPNNPGRIYLSGKGLSFPVQLPQHLSEKLAAVIEESLNQVSEMVDLLNKWLKSNDLDINLTMEEIRKKYAQKLVRERHIAKALRIKIEELSKRDAGFYELLKKVYGGEGSGKKRGDVSGLEDELRARLLKSGSPAFVPEDESAFLPLSEIMQIITAAGGLPTYPLLLDGTGGAITEFEEDMKKLGEKLTGLGIFSIEFIPSRNNFELLKRYASWFYEQGFVVSFGTEHNTTAMTPLTVTCKNGMPLDESLMEISFKGAAYIAAHQYLAAKEGIGYERPERGEMEELGKSVIGFYLA